MIIDTHPHLIASDLVRFPMSPVGGIQSLWSKDIHLTGDEFLDHMEQAGVKKAVLVQASTFHGYDNSYTAEIAAQHPDKFVGVGCIDAYADNAPEILTYWIKKRGMCGARLFLSGSTLKQDDGLDSPALDPFWTRADQLDIPVDVQITSSAFPELRTVLTRYPRLKIILDHLGSPQIEDGPPYRAAWEFFELAIFKNLFLKFSSNNLSEATVGKATPESFLESTLAAFGPNRLMWGSNFPNTKGDSATPYKAIVDSVRATLSSLTEEESSWLMGRTALELYPSLRNRKVP